MLHVRLEMSHGDDVPPLETISQSTSSLFGWQLNNLAQLDSFLVVYFKRLADELPIRLQFKQAPFLLRPRICPSYLFPQLDGTTNFVHVSGKKCSTTKDLKIVLSERKILWTGWDMVRSSRTEPNKPEAQQMSPTNTKTKSKRRLLSLNCVSIQNFWIGLGLANPLQTRT